MVTGSYRNIFERKISAVPGIIRLLSQESKFKEKDSKLGHLNET
jgi:hypothetical protein